MKQIINYAICVVILTLSAITINIQSQPSLIWGRQFGTDKEEYARNHVVDLAGNIYVTGNTQGIMNDKNFGKNDGFISKIDSLGNIIWSRQFGSDADEDVQWSAIDNEGFVYILGSTTGVLDKISFGKEDFFLVKYSSDGQKIWTKQFGSDSTDLAAGIFIDAGGYIYISGSTFGKLGTSSIGNQDAFIMKLDKNGIPIYINQFGTSAPDACTSITGDNKGNIYVSGNTFGNLGAPNKGFIDAFVGQFTDEGKLIKFTQFGCEGFDIPTSILVDNDGNIYSGGTTSGNIAAQQLGEGDCFLTKISKNGDVLWSNQFGTIKHDGIKGIAFNPKNSDNILVSGLFNLPPAHAFVRMYKKDGSLLWEKNLIAEGDSNNASGKDVSIDSKGYIYHLGLTSSNLFGTLIGVTDFYLIKLKME